MSRIWRVVMFIVLALAAAGVVLIGAALLTGASVPRIIELVFGGQAELEAWFRDGVDRAYALWSGALELLRNLF